MQDNGWDTYDPAAEQRKRPFAEWDTYDPEAEKKEAAESVTTEMPEEVEDGWPVKPVEAPEIGSVNGKREAVWEEWQADVPTETVLAEIAPEKEAEAVEDGKTEAVEAEGQPTVSAEVIPEPTVSQREAEALECGKDEISGAAGQSAGAAGEEKGMPAGDCSEKEETVPENGAAESRPEKEGTASGGTMPENVTSGNGAEAPESDEEKQAGAAEPSGGPTEAAEQKPAMDAEIAGQLAELNQRMEQLDRKFNEKIKTSESQDIMAKTLYAEVQEYKKGMYSDIMKPLLLELVQMRNNIVRQCRSIMEKEGSDARIPVQRLLDYGEDIRDVLEAYDVEIFSAEPGSEFDPRSQKLLKKVPVTREAMNKKVAASLCDGYKYRDRTIMKENVKVYVYEEETDKKETQ